MSNGWISKVYCEEIGDSSSTCIGGFEESFARSKKYKRGCNAEILWEQDLNPLLKLRASMVGTLTAIIALSTLFFTVILSLTGTFSITWLLVFVIGFNILQWLISPYLIDAIYRVRPVSASEKPELVAMVENLSQKSGIRTPKLMLARIPIPNAFAYGSPIAGSRVAVTEGLVKSLDSEEVEAVIGHELGHLKHRDVQVMMFVSILPAIFYYIGYSFMLSSMFGRRGRDEGGGAVVFIGLISIFLFWILTLFTLHLSRLREYYADRHGSSLIDDGPRKLSEGLAKIVNESGRMKKRMPKTGQLSSFKALFISDPDKANSDARALLRFRLSDRKLVEEVLQRRVTGVDRFLELFSTHPNIVKRLRALQKLGSVSG
ncbi:MAG: M48 family metalloprotease [Candidatus Bathyarchaeota archaeon]|jgi:heat shock protein HtpX|nr:MAG: M48 family metalloprotease [Candidatus Bathyarchaeota archaeon]